MPSSRRSNNRSLPSNSRNVNQYSPFRAMAGVVQDAAVYGTGSWHGLTAADILGVPNPQATRFRTPPADRTGGMGLADITPESWRSAPNTPARAPGPASLTGRAPLQQSLTNNNNMPAGRRRTPITKLMTRSAMKQTGKRVSIKKPKIVKVSKSFREKVKKVEEGQAGYGSYTKVYSGVIGSLVNANTTLGQASVSANCIGSSQRAILGPSHLEPCGSRTLWNTMINMKPKSDVSLPVPPVGNDFNYFTIQKIWDAVSVVFNRRAIALDAHANANDLLTTHTNAGNPYTNMGGTLSVNIKNSWVSFTMKNVSDRVLEVDIWELTPKLKFQDNAPVESLLDTFEGPAQQIMDSSTTLDATVRYYNVNGAAPVGLSGVGLGFILDGQWDPLSIGKKFGLQYNVVKKTMVLAPDETCKHSIKGPKGVLNFEKTLVENVQKLGMMKGFSISCLFGVRGDQVLQPTGTASGSRFLPLNAAPAAANSYHFGLPIQMEVEESMTFAVPEIAGFMLENATPGNNQALNLRKKKIVLANFVAANGDTNGIPYLVSNEVNPITGATSGGAVWA